MQDLKTNSKKIVKKILFQSKLYRLNILKNRCYILMYHMIPDTPTGFYAEVSKKDFEIHIAHLAANYNIISLTEYSFFTSGKLSINCLQPSEHAPVITLYISIQSFRLCFSSRSIPS